MQRGGLRWSLKRSAELYSTGYQLVMALIYVLFPNELSVKFFDTALSPDPSNRWGGHRPCDPLPGRAGSPRGRERRFSVRTGDIREERAAAPSPPRLSRLWPATIAAGHWWCRIVAECPAKRSGGQGWFYPLQRYNPYELGVSGVLHPLHSRNV